MHLTSILGIILAATLFIVVVIVARRNDRLGRMLDSELEEEDFWACQAGRFKNRFGRELARRRAARVLMPVQVDA